MKAVHIIIFLLICAFSANSQNTHYAGLWTEGNSAQYWYYMDSYEGFLEKDNFLSGPDHNQRLIDFDIFKIDGKVFYMGLWKAGTGQQEIRLSSSLAEWETLNNFFSNVEGLQLKDFEKYKIDGQDKYFSVWQEGIGEQKHYIHSTYEEFESVFEINQENNLVLTDFEKYEADGQDKYFSVWHTGNTDQLIDFANNLKDWDKLNREYQNKGYELVDFEQFKSNRLEVFFGVWQPSEIKYSLEIKKDIDIFNNNNSDLFFCQGRNFMDFEYYEIGISLPEKIITDEDLKGGQNYFWSNDTTYILDGFVYLEEDGILNIESGTIIKGKENPTEISIPTSALIIAKGAKIYAKGTQKNPIIFTVDTDPVNGFDTDPTSSTNLWGGLYILGEGKLGAPTTMLPIEGLDEKANYGGNNDSDDSGVLNYISIRFAGANIDDKPSAGLTLGGVGSTTELSYIEILGSGSNGIHLYGGTAFLKYATVEFTCGQSFLWNHGYRGNGIYWFTILSPSKFTFDPPPSTAILGLGGNTINPDLISNPTITNSTFVAGQFNISEEATIQLRDNSAGSILNSAFVHLNGPGIEIEDLNTGEDSRKQLERGNILIANNIWWDLQDSLLREFNVGDNGIIKVADEAEDNQALFLKNHLEQNNNYIQGNGIKWLNFNNGCIAIDPRLAPDSRYYELPNAPISSVFDSCSPPPNLKGAFIDDSLWLKNWTGLDLYYPVGQEAIPQYIVGDDILNEFDTIKIDCQDLSKLQDSIKLNYPCGPSEILGLGVNAERKGKRKRPGTRSGDLPAIIEEWELYILKDFEVVFQKNLVVLVCDTVAPTIHIIPDGRGGITSLVEDCDEAWLIEERKDTITDANGLCVIHYFEAQDYSGNTTSLEVKQSLGIGSPVIQYADLDKDGFGDPNLFISWNGVLPGFVYNNEDCNDNNYFANPNGNDFCLGNKDGFYNDGLDATCNGATNYDICQDAIGIVLDTNDSFSGVLSFKNTSHTIYPPLLSDCNFPKTYRDVWAKVIVPEPGGLEIDIYDDQFTADVGFNIEIYSGDCNQMTLLECGTGLNANFELDGLRSNSTIYIRIQEQANLEGSAVEIFAKTLYPPASNNLCSSSVELPVTTNCEWISFSNQGARESEFSLVRSQCGFASPPQDDVWFRVEDNESDTLVLQIAKVEGSDFRNGILEVYKSTNSCENLEYLTCSTISNSPIILTNVNIDTSYWLRIIEENNQVGNFQLCAQTFGLKTSSIDLNQDVNIEIYPNPIKNQNQIVLEIQSITPLNTSFELYNIHGQKVGETQFVDFNKGTNIYSLEIPNLKPGLFILKSNTYKYAITKKIIIVE